nr:glycosyltransferase [Novosphingobium nitrogenifigens]
MRQLLDLEPFWRSKDCFFVTEDTALTRDIAQRCKTYFIPHVALGQARLGKRFEMLRGAIFSVLRSLWIILRERPGVVVTTGAGSCYFPVLFARALGAKIVLIDSFARFQGPSAFARIASPLAHVRIAQSAQSARKWAGASVVDPFRRLGKATDKKEPLVFATVGATLPFERLIRLVDEAKRAGQIPEHVILQTGHCSPVEVDKDIETHEVLSFHDVQDILRRADIVICHAGTGSIITALQAGCRVIVIPRMFERGEHYDNHQWEIAETFANRGIVTMVGSDDDLGAALEKARASEPVRATLDQTELIGKLDGLVDRWAS